MPWKTPLLPFSKFLRPSTLAFVILSAAIFFTSFFTSCDFETTTEFIQPDTLIIQKPELPKPSLAQAAPVSIGKLIYRGDMGTLRGLLFYQDLSQKMTLVFDTITCGLIYAWAGPAVGPMRGSDSIYVPQGKIFLQKHPNSVWTVLRGVDTLLSSIRMTSFKEDVVGFISLRYQIEVFNYPALHEKRILTLVENSTYNAHYGSAAIIREFTCLGLDTNMTVQVSLTNQNPNWTEAWSSSAAGKLVDSLGVKTFILRDDHVSQVKVSFGDSL